MTEKLLQNRIEAFAAQLDDLELRRSRVISMLDDIELEKETISRVINTLRQVRNDLVGVDGLGGDQAVLEMDPAKPKTMRERVRAFAMSKDEFTIDDLVKTLTLEDPRTKKQAVVNMVSMESKPGGTLERLRHKTYRLVRVLTTGGDNTI